MCYAIKKTYERLFGPGHSSRTEDLGTLSGGLLYQPKSLSTGTDLPSGSLKRRHPLGGSNINVSEYQSTSADV